MQLKYIASIILAPVSHASYLRAATDLSDGLGRSLKRSKTGSGYKLTHGKFGRVSSNHASSDPTAFIVLQDDKDIASLECAVWLKEELWINFDLQVEVVLSYNDVHDDVVGYVERGISQAGCDDELHLLADQLPDDIYSRVLTDDGEALFLTKTYPDLDKNRRNYRDKKQCQDDCNTDSCDSECDCLDECDSDNCEKRCKRTCEDDCEREVDNFLKRWCTDIECKISIDNHGCKNEDKPSCDDNNLCTTDTVTCDDHDDYSEWLCTHTQKSCDIGAVCNPNDGECHVVTTPFTNPTTVSGPTTTFHDSSTTTTGAFDATTTAITKTTKPTTDTIEITTTSTENDATITSKPVTTVSSDKTTEAPEKKAKTTEDTETTETPPTSTASAVDETTKTSEMTIKTTEAPPTTHNDASATAGAPDKTAKAETPVPTENTKAPKTSDIPYIKPQAPDSGDKKEQHDEVIAILTQETSSNSQKDSTSNLFNGIVDNAEQEALNDGNGNDDNDEDKDKSKDKANLDDRNDDYSTVKPPEDYVNEAPEDDKDIKSKGASKDDKLNKEIEEKQADKKKEETNDDDKDAKSKGASKGVKLNKEIEEKQADKKKEETNEKSFIDNTPDENA